MLNFFKGKPFKCFIKEYENKTLISRSYKGVKAIEIDKIVGTVGRCHDNYSWNDLKDKVRFRGIKEAIEGMESMPAIQVYQIKDEYYIVDGHHRVMASREIDRYYIDADIIEYNYKKSADNEEANYHNCPGKDFSEKTNLQGILLNSRKSYQKLLSNIKDFGKKIEENLSLEELSLKWYDNQFLKNQKEIQRELDEEDKEANK